MMNNRVVPEDFIPFSQKENFGKMIALSEELSLKTKMEISKKGDTLKYTMKTKNRNLFSLKANGKTLEIKPALWNLENYRDAVEQTSDEIKSVIINAKACKNCTDKCGGGARFNIDGNEHYKCLFSGFKYNNSSEDDINILCELITLENDTRKK